MPFVNVKLVEGVFSTEEKHEMAKVLTDVMVALKDRKHSEKSSGF